MYSILRFAIIVYYSTELGAFSSILLASRARELRLSSILSSILAAHVEVCNLKCKKLLGQVEVSIVPEDREALLW